MKFFLLIILFLFFVSFGICVYFSYSIRVKVFRDMIHISNYLQNNISFNKCELNLLINKCYEDLSDTTKNLISNKNKFMPMMTNRDRKLINNFFCSIGKGDVRYEVENLRFYENELKERLKFHEDNQKNGSLYLKLIIGFGLMICIILI